MRKHNSSPEFSEERSLLLIKNFRESIARQSKISAAKAFNDAVNAPAPRFWVSEVRATRVIRQMLNGDAEILEGMNTEKREMYLEIFKRVSEIRKTNPRLPLGDIVFEVVNSPAPRFYLSPFTAVRIINKQRNL